MVISECKQFAHHYCIFAFSQALQQLCTYRQNDKTETSSPNLGFAWFVVLSLISAKLLLDHHKTRSIRAGNWN